MKGETILNMYIALETKAYRRQNLGRLLAPPLGVHRGASLAAGTTPRSGDPVGSLTWVARVRNGEGNKISLLRNVY